MINICLNHPQIFHQAQQDLVNFSCSYLFIEQKVFTALFSFNLAKYGMIINCMTVLANLKLISIGLL